MASDDDDNTTDLPLKFTGLTVRVCQELLVPGDKSVLLPTPSNSTNMKAQHDTEGTWSLLWINSFMFANMADISKT